MITNLRSGIVAGVLAVTTAIAGVGWYRSAHNENVANGNSFPYRPVGLTSSPGNLSNDPNGPRNFNGDASNGGYNNAGYNGNTAAYNASNGYNNCDGNGYATARSGDYAYNGAPYVSDRYVSSIHRPIRVSYARSETSYSSRPYNTGYVEHTRVVERYRHGRSIGKSVAIVGGSAAGGAAIGALAGGGKGAGIGALAGGLGGFVYDRLTHNR